MVPQRQSWPDVDGSPVTVGDWVEVFCTWTHSPKFDGRAVQVIDVLHGRGGTVFRLRDPAMKESAGQYLSADGHGYRRVNAPN